MHRLRQAVGHLHQAGGIFIEQLKKIWEWTGGVNEVKSRQVLREPPLAGQAEIRIEAIGICGTDLHIMGGQARFGPPPLPLGHELSGTVMRLGDGTRGWSVGDRVCIDPLIGCGHCAQCRAGNKHRCPDAGEIGLHYPGGWQQYLTIPASNLYKLPDEISLEAASQAETLHCCLGGIDKLSIRLGMQATVVGDGPTGLYYVQLLKAAGVGKVTLIGLQEHRLQLGRALGADLGLNAGRADVEVLTLANSQDIVIDAAGTERSVRTSIELLKSGGQLLVFGLPGNPILVDVSTVVLKELTLMGSTNAPHVWPRVIEMLAGGTVRVNPLITRRYSFDRLDEALAFARDPASEAVKVIVTELREEART
ncbi:zinc-binding dehydrogenase [Cohnella sp. GCM10020058]|uniref:zinc-dependent alcohol dehydrogenase n=1 Tax=Cohnella sp. GCM10020058 TaxID=3317330 RepID=UPI00363F0020